MSTEELIGLFAASLAAFVGALAPGLLAYWRAKRRHQARQQTR